MTLPGRSRAPTPPGVATPTIAVLAVSESGAVRVNDDVALLLSRLPRLPWWRH
jgi:hypothetical protein